jgi:hypothetical protein
MLSVRKGVYSVALCVLVGTGAANTPAAAQWAPLYLASPDFTNGSILPLSTINNIVSNNVNACTANGAAGGDQSPPLFWGNVPYGTRYFALVLFDVTASFTHWGIYNIPAYYSGLPANAGAAGNTPYGTQIVDDGGVTGYFGPCPPANLPPDTHRYVFTLYALDKPVNPPGSVNFPTNSESLFQALLDAGLGGHVLATATLTGLYSSTPN